jgi:hypothetical protein
MNHSAPWWIYAVWTPLACLMHTWSRRGGPSGPAPSTTRAHAGCTTHVWHQICATFFRSHTPAERRQSSS